MSVYKHLLPPTETSSIQRYFLWVLYNQAVARLSQPKGSGVTLLISLSPAGTHDVTMIYSVKHQHVIFE